MSEMPSRTEGKHKQMRRPNCIRWLEKIKNFHRRIDKLLNWSSSFAGGNTKSEAFSSFSCTSGGNFISFFLTEILYDFPCTLTLRCGWRLTIKMSSRSLCCKRQKMKSFIHRKRTSAFRFVKAATSLLCLCKDALDMRCWQSERISGSGGRESLKMNLDARKYLILCQWWSSIGNFFFPPSPLAHECDFMRNETSSHENYVWADKARCCLFRYQT